MVFHFGAKFRKYADYFSATQLFSSPLVCSALLPPLVVFSLSPPSIRACFTLPPPLPTASLSTIAGIPSPLPVSMAQRNHGHSAAARQLPPGVELAGQRGSGTLPSFIFHINIFQPSLTPSTHPPLPSTISHVLQWLARRQQPRQCRPARCGWSRDQRPRRPIIAAATIVTANRRHAVSSTGVPPKANKSRSRSVR